MNLDDHCRDMASKASANHEKFQSFGWHDCPDDAQEWCVVYTSSRDSGLVDESNAATIAKEMEPFLSDPEMIRTEHHSHWACGYVDGYAIRVFTDASHTEVTPAFKKWCELSIAMENYPVLDSNDYSQREYDATIKNIEYTAKRWLKDGVPEDWAKTVFGHMWDSNSETLETVDDRGGCPSEDDVREALRELGFHEPEDDT